jgi:hypothetical protein
LDHVFVLSIDDVHGVLVRRHSGHFGAYDLGVAPDLEEAVRASHLRGLAPKVLEELFEGASRRKIAAGSVAHWALDDDPYVELVITGVIRVFVTAPDGRTITIRYCRSGELLGAMSLFSEEFTEPATKQALVDTEMLVMDPWKVASASPRPCSAWERTPPSSRTRSEHSMGDTDRGRDGGGEFLYRAGWSPDSNERTGDLGAPHEL